MKSLKAYIKWVLSGELQIVAGSLAYSTLLSIIPFFTVGLATLQYFNGLDILVDKAQIFIYGFFNNSIPDEDLMKILDIIRSFNPTKLGVFGAIGLVVTSMLLLQDMEKAFHFIWKIPNKRPLYKRFFVYWLLVLTIPVAGAILAGFHTWKFMEGLRSGIPASITTVLYALPLFILLFKWVPNTNVKWRAAAIGAAISSIGVSILFQFYQSITKSLLNYSVFYGGLASIPTFLLWLLFLWYVILLGVAASAAFNKGEL